MNDLRLQSSLGALFSLVMFTLTIVFILEADTPIAKDILHLQNAIKVCNDKELQPFSTDHNSVTCSDGKVYHLEK